MKRHITLEGDEELHRMFKELDYRLASELVKSVASKGGRLIVNEARRETPTGPTGNLKRSLGIIRPRNSSKILVGARMKRGQKGHHAGFVAYGTKRMKKKNKVIGEWIAEAAGRVENQVKAIMERESAIVMDKRLKRYLKRI